ncbi:hypothetical protein [Sporosarcina sp. FSL K6-1508]|uniref:hypothetical protein n=1 Tax=Sporosarcina sp. FSL K6-1508 TaxID=2921553 RepID=UPI0030F9A461
MNIEEFKKRYVASLKGVTWDGEQIEVTDLELIKLFASNVVVSEFYEEEARKEKGRI